MHNTPNKKRRSKMSKQFTNRYLQGIFEPLDSEYNIENCIVNGQIPKELNGSLYKIGSNPQFVYSANYHLFGGDGMIHKIDFNNGVVVTLTGGLELISLIR